MGDYWRNRSWNGSNKIISMDVQLEQKVRSALKLKWMNNDHNINLKKMVEFYQTTPITLKEIIRQYESELLATKFNIIE